MTLSADLITRYRTEVDVDWRHAFILSHPQATPQYIIGHTSEYTAEGDDGMLHDFKPVPISLTPVSQDDSGRQEMALVFETIQLEAKAFLDAAIADGTEPVTCKYSVFFLTSTTPQIDPWIEFHLMDIQITTEAVTATASRADIINRRFPTEVYRVDRFPGLNRR